MADDLFPRNISMSARAWGQRTAAAILGAATLLISPSAHAALPPYVVLDLGLPDGVSYIWVSGLSDAGHVVGSVAYPNATFRAWVWRDGTMTLLPSAGGTWSKAYGVNSNGWIVGESAATPGGPSVAALWMSPDQPPMLLGTLGGTTSYATSVNNAGIVVGRSQITGNSGAFGFVWQNGVMTSLGALPGGASNNYSTANMINENSWIVGVALGTNGYPNPFSWYTGTMNNLAATTPSGEAISINNVGGIVGLMRWGSLDQATMFRGPGVTTPINLGRLAGDTEGAAHDINDSSAVIGNSASPSRTRATIWLSGTPSSLRDLNTMISPLSGWSLTSAMRINNSGRIVGNGRRGGVNRIFMLAPRCPADVDDGSGSGLADGGVGIEDLLQYLSWYQAGIADADLDNGTASGQPDGGVGVEDLLYYLQRYESGC